MDKDDIIISKKDLIRKLKAWDSKANGIPNYAWGVINDMPPINIEALNAVIIPDNATNGDIIKIMFPDIEIADIEALDEHIYTGIPFNGIVGANIDCTREWWNAPYRG